MKFRVGKRLKSFGPMKNMCNVRVRGLSMTKELKKKVVVPLMMYGAETQVLGQQDRKKLYLIKLNT